MIPVKDVALVPAQDSDETALIPTFERLARDPNISAEKIERLMALFERGQAKKAEAAFNAAMSVAQREMRTVAPDTANPQTRSRYASYAALDAALRPIYTANGFGLSFDTADAPSPDYIRLLCYVTHTDGHARTYRLDMPADGKGAKGGDVMTKTHATGSAATYGMRYLLKMIFNVAVGDVDDDGNAAVAPHKPEQDKPKGYDNWLEDLDACADEGSEPLKEAWRKSPATHCAYLTTTNSALWNRIKIKAANKSKEAK